MGRGVSHHQPDVAPELGAPDAVFRLPGGHSQGDLHDQRHRVAEHVAAQGDQDAGIVSECGCGAETAIPGAGAHCQEVDHAGAELESGLAAFCDSAGRPRPARRAGIAAARKGTGDSREPWISGGLKRGVEPKPWFHAPSSVDAAAKGNETLRFLSPLESLFFPGNRGSLTEARLIEEGPSRKPVIPKRRRKRPKRRFKCGPWKSGNPKPGFPLFHRPD